MSDTDPLRCSPLHEEHLAIGAKMVPFGGWLMPLAYSEGTITEHLACRRGVAVFDVSHLGTVRVKGPDAFAVLQSQFTNDLAKIHPGRAQYTHLLDEDGSVLDDIIVWWVKDDVFDVMPNASNTDRVRGSVGGEDVTARRAVIAVQGPGSRQLLDEVLPEAATIGRFVVRNLEWDSVPCVVAGTGYTGEDGVECAVPAEAASLLWRALLRAGAHPAGLGARDTLRLEAGLPLHGHELGPGITPLQAGLGWVVGWSKPDFRGRQALLAERDEGPARMLRGMVSESRQPPRSNAAILDAKTGQLLGQVTSGNFSPVLERGIALGFIDAHASCEVGSELTIDVRGRHLRATVVSLPFVRPGQLAGSG